MTETKNKVTDIRVRRTYDQLTDALIKLLAQKSFDDLTVLEICSQPILYSHINPPKIKSVAPKDYAIV